MATVSIDSIRVLHVDDEPDLADVTAQFLAREDERFAIETATSATEAIEQLHAEAFDCIVSDYDMPGRSGIEFLEVVREDYPELPFLLYTGKGSEEVASDAISAGVTDYLQKEAGTDQYTVLANRIINAVEHYRSRQQVERSERRLREIIDSLPHILYVADEEGRYLLANEALADFHDAAVSEIQGATLTEVLDESEADRFQREHRDVIERDAQKHVPEVRVSDAAGETHVFEPEILPYDFTDTDDRAVLGIGVDVTERRERERRLEQTRERMQFALEHTQSLIFEIDFRADSVIRHGDFAQFFELRHEDVATWEEYLDTAVHPDDRTDFRRFYEQLRTGERNSGELEYRTNPELGEVRWIRDNVYVNDRAEAESRQVVGVAGDITDRRQREQELERKERRYQAIFNDPNILVGLIDTDGTVLDVNQTAMEYVEAARDDVIGDPFWETPWFDHSIAVKDDVKQWIERAASGKYVEFEVDLVRPNGELYTIQGVFRPVRNDDGEVVSLIISDREITVQKQRERELERTNALLSTLFDALPVGVLAVDGSNNVLAVNQEMFDQFDRPGSSEALVGSDARRLANEVSDRLEHPERFVDWIDEVASDRKPIRNEAFSFDDGRTIALSHYPIELSQGDGHLWMSQDVTDREEHEHRLEILNETTRKLMTAQSREAVAEIGVDAASEVLDLDANAVHLVDEAAAALVPIAQSEGCYRIIGDPPTLPAGDSIAWRVYERGEAALFDDIHDDPARYNADSPFHSELLLPIGDYGILIAGATATDVFDEADLVLGEILANNVAAALEQVEQTEQVRAREHELKRQNDRLEEFVSIVSHDLRNPMNVAENWVELAMDEHEIDELENVARALDRMDVLIDDLLTLAREGDRVQEMERVDFAELSRQCWRTVDTASATLTVETGSTFRADRTRLKQLLENLYRNAVEHGGEDVSVTVGDTETGFFVADDGTGISTGRRETVFDAGYSTSQEGTGLGLSIVKQVAEAHDWELAVTESVQGGARFEITDVDF